MAGLLRRFMQDQSGAAAVHYGLIVAGVSAALIAIVAANALKYPSGTGLLDP